VQVVTNGTVLPRGDVVDALKNRPDASVYISNYGALSAKKDELADMLTKSGVAVISEKQFPKWRETGGVKYRDYTQKELKREFRSCSRVDCKSLFQGKLWRCSFAPSGVSLGLLRDCAEDYIDLRRDYTKEEFDKLLKRLYRCPSGEHSACRFCKSNYSAKAVPCAEQSKIKSPSEA